MKSIGALALVFAVAIVPASGPAAANPAERGGTSGDSMSGMMGGPAAGMMRSMPMNAPSEALGRGCSGRGEGTRGAEEMQRFMSSERMPQAMSAMMAMAERMGGGDTMLGMVRMMEMMSMMGGDMMGGDGMIENPPRSQPRGEERK